MTTSTKRPDPYRDAIDEALIVRHLGVAKGDAKAELEMVLAWEVSVALDPLVSSSAQALIDQGRSESPAPQPPVEGLREALDGLVVAVESECYLDDKSVAFRNRLNEAKRALASPSLTAGASREATWTHDDEAAKDVGHLYYFAPKGRSPGPYLTQRHVDAIIDIASDGTLAGVELIDNMPPPPAPATLIEQSDSEKT